MKKKCIGIFIGIAGATGLLSPLLASASTLPFFGGFDAATFPCTCDVGTVNWHFFPLLYRSVTPATTIFGAPLVPPYFGALAAPISVAFSTYVMRPETYTIGSYVPVAQGCWVGVPPACFVLPSYGFVAPLTGVSPVL